MSLVSFKEINNGRGGDDEALKDGRSVRRYTRVFRAITSSVWDGAEVIKPSTPSIAASYAGDTKAKCKRRRFQNHDKAKKVWTVTCYYSTATKIEDNPLDDPALISWGSAQYQEAFIKDRDGDAVTNSAGQYFVDPTPERDRSRLTSTCQKNLAQPPAWLLTYNDGINDADFNYDGLVVPKNAAKVQSLSVSPVQERNEIEYRVVAIVFHFDSEKLWRIWLLDQGRMEIDDTDSSQRRNIQNEGDGERPTIPVLLDGAGSALANPSPANAEYMKFDPYTEMDFSVLPTI